MQNKS